MQYRPDIDGLRAIAIMLVLIYHGGLGLFPAGFIGVDLFFVISGFLISSIIFQSLNNASFSFINFYSRRLWRLQPAFLCMIVCAYILSFALLLPDDLLLFNDSAIKSSIFIANIYFLKTTTGYFAPNTHQLPLLHTWSLSIEWQCYLILPLLIFGLHKLCKPRILTALLVSLTIATLMIAISSAHKAPLETYYQFSSRIFEFLIGSCVARMLGSKLNSYRISYKAAYLLDILGFIALMGIIYTATRADLIHGYPNYYALLVCLATGFLIALGCINPKQKVLRVLSLKPLVFIGLLSYSLYLWHWLVFSFIRYESVAETPTVIAIAYCLSFTLAYLCWKFVEKPARRLHNLKFAYTFASLIVVPIACTLTASLLLNKYSGFPQRFSQDLAVIYLKLKQYSSADRPLCISKDDVDINEHCIVGSKEAGHKKAFMIGDSFSNHYWGFIDTLAKNANTSVLVQGTSSCLTLPNVYLFDWWYFSNKVYQECYDNTQKYYQMIKANDYDFVLISHLWSNYYDDNVINKVGDARSLELSKKRLEESLDSALSIIVQSGAKPILIQSTATMQDNFHDCVFKYIKLRKAYSASYCSFELQPTDADLWIKALFAKMQAKYPQLLVIDPKAIQCPQNRCKSDLAGVPVYRDAGHITDYASYEFGRLYLEQFANPFV